MIENRRRCLRCFPGWRTRSHSHNSDGLVAVDCIDEMRLNEENGDVVAVDLTM